MSGYVEKPMFLFTSLAKTQQEPQANPVMGALRTASANSGVSFDYLVETARRESALKPNAKAATSSARGLFQFIEQTWLSVVRSDGAKAGLAKEAAAISGGRGRFTVNDSAMRQRILALRNDPEMSARFAAVLARQNHDSLTGSLGREPTQGELYMAHFLGVEGARKLIAGASATPAASAAAQFPRAAQANASIFYDRAGHARSLSQVYARLTRGFSPSELAVKAVPAAEPAQAQQEAAPPLAVAAGGNAFHSLFVTGKAQAPLAPSQPVVAAPRPLDLAYFRRRQG